MGKKRVTRFRGDGSLSAILNPPRGQPLVFEKIQPFDDAAFRLINGAWTNPAFDFFFRHITDFGLFQIPLIIAGIVLLIFVKPRMKYVIVLMVLSVLIADMIGQDFKIIFERLRPYFALENVRLPAGGGTSKSYSFPSNHAINMFAAMTVLAWEFRKKIWLSLLCFVPAILVAYSRVYVGVHYPSDVMGGALIGMTCSGLILTIDRFFPFVSHNAETKKVVLNWMGLSLLLLIFATAYRYSVIARGILPLSAEECQYWDWSRRLDLSYYSKPPAIAYIIRFFTELFGTSEFAVRAGAVTLSAGMGIVTVLFTTELFRNQRTTFFTLFSMNIIPLFSLGAIGVQEAIFSLLMMKNGFICESANIEELDPMFADVPIVRQRQDNVSLNCVMSNSFGFGGTNATLIFKQLDA